jgi:hypothetical protein
LSKEHYQQQSYMEPLLIVHQQRFLDTTTIDIEININNSSTYEPLLIYRLQQWFHVEPLLILDTINSGPTFRLKSLGNFLFPSDATATGPPSRKRLERTLPLLGPHRCRRRCAGTLSPPPPPPCQDLFDATFITAMTPSSMPPSGQGAPARKHRDLTPPCQIAAPAWIDAVPHADFDSSIAGPR